MSENALVLLVSSPHSASPERHEFARADVVIGKSAECDLVLDAEMVSRRHVRLSVEDGRLFAEDEHSTNGTFLNGHRLEGREAVSQNDVLRVIDFMIRIESFAGFDADRTTVDFRRPLAPTPPPQREPARPSAVHESPKVLPIALLGVGAIALLAFLLIFL